MKNAQDKWKLGQLLVGQVVECLSQEELIISIDGELWRVGNETRRPLHVGQRVRLVVTAIKPPRFQLVGSSRQGHLDVRV